MCVCVVCVCVCDCVCVGDATWAGGFVFEGVCIKTTTKNSGAYGKSFLQIVMDIPVPIGQ